MAKKRSKTDRKNRIKTALTVLASLGLSIVLIGINLDPSVYRAIHTDVQFGISALEAFVAARTPLERITISAVCILLLLWLMIAAIRRRLYQSSIEIVEKPLL